MSDSPQWPMRFPTHQVGAVKVEIDDGAGMAYIAISNSPVARTVERYKGRVLVDLDENDNTVGVELFLAVDPHSSILPPERRWRLRMARKLTWRFLKR
jgi:uncharacterized protein YuzE